MPIIIERFLRGSLANCTNVWSGAAESPSNRDLDREGRIGDSFNQDKKAFTCESKCAQEAQIVHFL